MSPGIELVSSEDYAVVPKADEARQAVHTLRGFVYQVAAAALAWLDIDEHSRIYLEVAEDYARVARGAIRAVQVKDTPSSKVTLSSESVRSAIANFVALVELNPRETVNLHYFTTSEVGTEKAFDNPASKPGLLYWRLAASGSDIGPLRQLLTGDGFPPEVREFVSSRSDDAVRSDLLRRIHWECGQPNLVALREEFKDRLTTIAWERFNVPSQAIDGLSDALLTRVLTKSIQDDPANRRLTRGDLISAIQEASRVSISVQTIERLATGTPGGPGSPQQEGLLPSWIVPGGSLSAPKGLMLRAELIRTLRATLNQSSVLYLYGASGVGKTHAVRSLAQETDAPFFLVDFRDASVDECSHRLSLLLSKLGEMRCALLVLEDLNHIDDKRIENQASALVEAVVRRDIQLIVTTYKAPTVRTLSSLGHDLSSVLQCPYFTENESAELVSAYGGDVRTWARLAHATGAFGHPQLVHAFVAGVSSRGWKTSEVTTIVDAGLSTADLDAERTVARRLISELPHVTRQLLYRLSLSVGSFTRSTALSIATSPPPLADSGESFDSLIGPWVEALGPDNHRVSPLASTAGRELLSPTETKQVHHAFAATLLSRARIGAWEIDKIIIHALLGGNTAALTSVANSLITGGERLARYLSESGSAIQLLDFSKPIYPDNPAVSSMLRLAQFTILSTSSKPQSIAIAACVNALLQETELQAPPVRDMFRIAALAKVLGTLGIANHLPNWFDLLLEFRTIVHSTSVLPEVADLELMKLAPSTALFRIGMANLAKVSLLEGVFDRLNVLESDVRAELLAPLDDHSDYAVLVNSPWVAEQTSSIDALETEERYRRMAHMSLGWGIPEISVLCSIAVVVMRDEYSEDFDGALQAVDEAVAIHGDIVPLRRARAKVYWRAQKHELALPLLREIADEVGQGSNIERAFALREAAVSAAKVGDWEQARTWFTDARVSADKAKLADMTVMAAGLSANAAVASQNLGLPVDAIRELGDALLRIESIPADSSLRAAHTHRLIRHCVLWVHRQLEGRTVQVGGAPLTIIPGMCSNPEPTDEIANAPLGSMTIALYLLAECEVMAGPGLVAREALDSRLGGKSIPAFEVDLSKKMLWREMMSQGREEVAECLIRYGNALSNIPLIMGRPPPDLVDPVLSTPQTLNETNASQEVLASLNDALRSCLIVCACENRSDMMFSIALSLQHELASRKVDCSAAEEILSTRTSQTWEGLLVRDALQFTPGSACSALIVASAGIRFLQHSMSSQFRSNLIRQLSGWHRENWRRIITKEAFGLVAPRLAVPRIQEILQRPDDDTDFVLSMTLAGADAVGISIPSPVLDQLVSIARA